MFVCFVSSTRVHGPDPDDVHRVPREVRQGDLWLAGGGSAGGAGLREEAGAPEPGPGLGLPGLASGEEKKTRGRGVCFRVCVPLFFKCPFFPGIFFS